MQLNRVPHALVVRLGDDGTVALLEVLDCSQREARNELIVACTERFERRLVEEISGVRVQIAELGADLRQDISAMRADLRQEMAAGRADLFKWCFLFWVGQVLAISGIMGVMLRLMR